MDFSSVAEFFERFQTERVIEFLNDMNVGELIYNPLFLGIMGGLAILALIMRWRMLLVTLFSVVGFAGLISYTLERGTDISSPSDPTLLIFVVAGAVLVMAAIYFLFIKGD
ncbi:MAG: hypothetical protein SCI25_09790 [Desulfuromonadales bacterium]|nr:hypothetical protein [Desulfuromonadales bacterium]MDW7758342.1 hypothetical protein [Desulfuromonadales bacterium]